MASWIFIIIAGLVAGVFLGRIIDRLRGIDAGLARIDGPLESQASLQLSAPPHSRSLEFEVDGVSITYDGEYIELSGPDQDAIDRVRAGFGMTLVPIAEAGGAA